MKIKALIGLSIAAGAGLACEAAMARVSIGVDLAVPAPVYAAPAYSAPAYVEAPVEAPPPPPVGYQPPPPPPPVVYQPAPPPPPVVYQPAPVMVAPPVVVGWYGGRYWDGHRYWARRDWYAHHGGGYRHW